VAFATDEITWSEQVYRIFGFDRGARDARADRSRVPRKTLPILNEMTTGASHASDFEYEHRLQYAPTIRSSTCTLSLTGTRDRDVSTGVYRPRSGRKRMRRPRKSTRKVRLGLRHTGQITSLASMTASDRARINQPLRASHHATPGYDCCRRSSKRRGCARNCRARFAMATARLCDHAMRRSLAGERATESVNLNEAQER